MPRGGRGIVEGSLSGGGREGGVGTVPGIVGCGHNFLPTNIFAPASRFTHPKVQSANWRPLIPPNCVTK